MKRPNHPPSSAEAACAITGFISKTSGGTVLALHEDPRHAIEGFKYIEPDIACFFLIAAPRGRRENL